MDAPEASLVAEEEEEEEGVPSVEAEGEDQDHRLNGTQEAAGDNVRPTEAREDEEEEDPTPAYLRNTPFLHYVSRIEPRLYLSGLPGGLMYRELKRHDITHILVVAFNPEMRYPTDFVYKRLSVFDTEDEDLLSLFESCINFINEGRARGGVLVHCMAGVSRSATIVTAWLMKEYQLDAETALRKLKKKRSVINPNESFRWQLHQWEAMRYTLSGSTPAHQQYIKWKKRTDKKRRRLREKYKQYQATLLGTPHPPPEENHRHDSRDCRLH